MRHHGQASLSSFCPLWAFDLFLLQWKGAQLSGKGLGTLLPVLCIAPNNLYLQPSGTDKVENFQSSALTKTATQVLLLPFPELLFYVGMPQHAPVGATGGVCPHTLDRLQSRNPVNDCLSRFWIKDKLSSL